MRYHSLLREAPLRFFAPLVLLALAPAPSARAVEPTGDVPARLVGGALVDGQAYADVAELTDTIGARLTGSPGASAAVEWAVARLRAAGLHAWTEPVRVPHWVRGEERAVAIAAPPARPQPLAVAALGSSAGTPPGGVEAEVVEVRSLEEAAALGDRARGRIVLFQHGMPGQGSYGELVRLRARGPATVARLGAAGALVRSLASASLRDPHTGQTAFPPDVAPIPAASISVEDAELLHRLLARGPVRVRLVLGCGPGTPPEVESANVVAELPGRARQGEIVLIGAHLDSWDLATGAIDDGAGVAMVLEAMRLLAREPAPPRRTVRAVLFMNEEHGLSGGIAYAERHAAELGHVVAAVEADSGAGRPLGWKTEAGPGAVAILTRLSAPLATLGANGVRAGDAGSDLDPLRYAGVPTAGLWQDGSRYFEWHHSAADTLDKIDPGELARAAAALAVGAWQLAEADATMPRPPPPAEPPWWKPVASGGAAPASDAARGDRPGR